MKARNDKFGVRIRVRVRVRYRPKSRAFIREFRTNNVVGNEIQYKEEESRKPDREKMRGRER